MSGKICDVCGVEEENVKVASSYLGAVSFAYCDDCLKVGAEPYGMLVVTASIMGANTIEDFAEYAHQFIHASLLRAGKTLEDFYADIKVANDQFAQDMLMYEQFPEFEEDDEFFK